MRKHTVVAFIAATAALCSFACTNTVTLSYAGAGASQPAVAPAVHISVGDFSDNRHEPSRWIGAIRGGYGNPLKKLETDKLVAELVKEAFRQALIARGLYGNDGQFVLSGWIDRLDGDQYVRKEATVQLHVSLTDRTTQREILSRPASSNQVEGSIVTMKSGVFGSVEVLRSLIERVLSDAIDSFLDNSAFRDAVRVSATSETRSGASLKETIHVGMPLIDLTSIAPRPLTAVDKLNAAGGVVGKTFTYDNGDGHLLIVTVENGTVTSIVLR